jgi:hypothetical protein
MHFFPDPLQSSEPVEYIPSGDLTGDDEGSKRKTKHISIIPTIRNPNPSPIDESSTDGYALQLVWSHVHRVVYCGCCMFSGMVSTPKVTRKINVFTKRPSSGDCSSGPSTMYVQFNEDTYEVTLPGGIQVAPRKVGDNIYDFCDAEGAYYPLPEHY